LLDLKLPKITGIEVLKQIRDDQALQLLPVVILTSSNQERDLTAAYIGGCNAYVIKPVDPLQFHTAVRELGLFWTLTNQAPPDHA
jgi:two-component system response regulator